MTPQLIDVELDSSLARYFERILANVTLRFRQLRLEFRSSHAALGYL
jgi:hypothetical protein